MCFYPSLIKNKKYTANQKNGGIIPPILDKRVLAVPIGCGNCLECRKQKAREWQVRLLEDVRHNTNGKFITLTFSNESIKDLTKEVTKETVKVKDGIKKQYVDKNGKLRTRWKYKYITKEIILNGYETDNAIATLAMRRFLERWRKEHGKSLRHWFITELGHRGTENIHMHGIAWTNEEVQEIRKRWDYGFVWIGEINERGIIKNYVNEKTVNYIMKYVQKMDFDHREYKPKILTSAGIGSGYLERLEWETNKYNGEETREYYVTATGHKMALPIYLRNKIYSDDEKEKLWLIKLDKEVRYVGGEKVDVSQGYEEYYELLEHYRRKNVTFGYGTGTRDWNRKKYEEDRRNLLIQERIGAVEDAYAPRGTSSRLGSAPESAESINDSLRSQDAYGEDWKWKREMGWEEEDIIWGKAREESEDKWWE